jgi:cardiolipin synthase C
VKLHIEMLKWLLVVNFLFPISLLGQEIEILPDATASLAKRIHAIRNTKEGQTIKLSCYIFAADDIGKLITYELGEVLNKGVKVEIMFDAQGVTLVKPTTPYLQYLNTLGAKVKLVNPILAPPISFNRRMHDKIMMIDQSFAIIGGRNLWAYAYDMWSKPQLDMEVIVKDESTIKEMTDYWKERWDSKSSKDFLSKLTEDGMNKIKLELSEHIEKFQRTDYYQKFKTWLKSPKFDRVNLVRFIRDNRWKKFFNLPQIISPLKTWDHIEEIELLLASAKTEILIESPWIVLTRRMKAALSDAKKRGVKVRILTNSAESSESSYTYYVSRATSAKYMERNGIEVFEHNASVSLHSKYIVVDRKKAYIGSFNIGARSERLNSETGIIFESEKKGKEVAEEFDRRVANSEPARPYRFLNNPCINLMSLLLGGQI